MKYILWITLTILTNDLCAQPLKPRMAEKYKTNKVKDSISLKNGGMVYLYQDRSNKIRFIGQICLGNFEVAKGDLYKWGTGASADIFFNKYLSLHAECTKEYIDLLQITARENNQTRYDNKAVSTPGSLEAGVRVFIRDEQTKRRHRVIVARHSYGGTTTDYNITPMLPCWHMLALRAGYIGYNSIVTTDMNGSGTVLTKDGTLLTNSFFTNSVSNGGYIGVANLVLISAVTKNSFRNGVYLSRAVNELYADILFANTSFNAIADTNGSHEIVSNAKGSFQTFPVGARVGYKKSRENRGTGSEKIELGYRPGLKGTGFYFNFGFSFALIK